jgi:DMSO/TMAO reductase YedYZ molybdopterin-dependent catalytic subunit
MTSPTASSAPSPGGSPAASAESGRVGPPTDTRGRYAAAGLAAGAIGVGVASVLALVLSVLGLGEPLANPVFAVGAAVVDATPAWLKDFAVSAFGTADKVVLGVGIGVVLAGLFVGVGLVGRTRHTVALAATVALGGIALAAVVTRTGSGTLDPLPTVIGVGAALWALTRSWRGVAPSSSGPNAGVVASGATTRRLLLEAGFAGGVAALASGVSARPSAGSAAASRATVVLPSLPPPTVTGGATVSAAAPSTIGATVPGAVPGVLPGVADADLGVAGVTPWQVPSALFYRIDTALVPPRLTAADWRLRVWGEVEREVTLTWAQLVGKPLIQRYVTLACVSNEVGGHLVGNALWTGWPVRELLREAGAKAGADMVLSRSIDGWTAGTPLSALTDDRDALLAVAMNGVALPFEHGFPVRLVVPGLYGYVSATKWVTDLKVTRVRRRHGLLDAARLVGPRASQDRLAHRRPALGGSPACRSGRGGWRRVGHASRHPGGAGAGRRRPVGRRATGNRTDRRLMAAVGVRVGRRTPSPCAPAATTGSGRPIKCAPARPMVRPATTASRYRSAEPPGPRLRQSRREPPARPTAQKSLPGAECCVPLQR